TKARSVLPDAVGPRMQITGGMWAVDGKSGAPWYSGLPLKAMPDFAWMADIFEHDRISPSGINAVPTKRHQCCAHQAAEILGSSRFTGKGGHKNGMAGPFRFVTRFRRCLCCSALLRWRRRDFTLPVLAIIVLRGLLARMLVRHAFVWLLFVTVLHMWNDFGFDGFFGLRRRVLRIGSDDQQDSQRSEAFFHHIYVRVLLLLPERSKAGCIVGTHLAAIHDVF
ncbi:hypothetical protein, partial [Cardiobacterium valvarum]